MTWAGVTLLEAATAYQVAARARIQARDQLREAVRQAVADGMSEVEAARVAGVTRMTVRAWTGKPPR